MLGVVVEAKHLASVLPSPGINEKYFQPSTSSWMQSISPRSSSWLGRMGGEWARRQRRATRGRRNAEAGAAAGKLSAMSADAGEGDAVDAVATRGCQ